MAARHYIVKGRVQGVGFRYFVYNIATDLGVRGWVRNLPSGDVEIHAEGEESQLEEFTERVNSGPSMAAVRDLEVSPVTEEEHMGFSIRA